MATPRIFQLTISGPEVSKIFEIPLGATIIGRSAEANLVLPNSMVSRRHAQLNRTETECLLVDLGSANGTQVDGSALTPQAPVALADGSRITIGPFDLVLKITVIEEVEPAVEVEVEPEPVVPRAIPEPPKAESEPAKVQPIEQPLPERRQPVDPYDVPPGLSTESLYLMRYLPPIYHTDFMARFLALFEAVLMPSAWTVDNFDLFLSPGTAPSGFLPWLANWYEISFDDSWNEDQRRALLGEAGQIYSRLGTRYALRRVLQIYTGCEPEIVEFTEGIAPHNFTVILPANGHALKQDLVERLIDGVKPAHTSYRLEIRA